MNRTYEPGNLIQEMRIVNISRDQIGHAAGILTRAFENDPLFRYIFPSRKKYLRLAPWLFSTWIRWAILYGRAWMTEDGNGVVLLRSPSMLFFSFPDMLRTGMLQTPFRIGLKSFKRLYFEVARMLYKKHCEKMGDQPHWYGWMIGVYPASKGIGRDLLKHCFEITDKDELPIYIETTTVQNVNLYQYKGFTFIEEIFIGKERTPVYLMIRQPTREKE
ncbi:MAG: hypothetical protein INR73_17605 [Williamsia sp.]|nr:hypothetical protein [Williamsia sp.]